jgi:hypothetical protein
MFENITDIIMLLLVFAEFLNHTSMLVESYAMKALGGCFVQQLRFFLKGLIYEEQLGLLLVSLTEATPSDQVNLTSCCIS